MSAAASATTVPVPSREEVMARARGENFPVASRLLPREQRARLLAVYGFARLTDELGDEAPGDRLALLDWLDGEVDRLYDGRRPTHPVVRALVPAVRALAIPPDPFRRLIAANRRDQEVAAYGTFDELLDYCRLSAAPVGELVLYVFGAATPDRIRLSDRICAGLQVTEHLQDVIEDRARGRVYLPATDLERFGCADADLQARTPSPGFRAVMALEAGRARALFAAGAPLVRTLPLRPRVAVAGFIAGGRAALDALERSGYDVLGRLPRPTRRAFALQLGRALGGR